MPWSSTCTASRLAAGSSDGPLGTAQDTSTPSTSSRRSKCSVVAWWRLTTNPERRRHGTSSPGAYVSMSQDVLEAARRARDGRHGLALATRARKDRALHAMADALLARGDEVLAANAEDVARAEADGYAGQHRRPAPARRPSGSRGWPRACATSPALPDPVGEVVRGSTLANGLELRQVRVPFGVVGMIYEARPNVTADAAGICLKSGNAVLLRGSSSARSSNAAIVAVLRDAAAAAGLDADVVQLVPGRLARLASRR